MFLKKINSQKNQSGISLVILLLIIVILALLSAVLVNINSQSNLSNAHNVISTRAFFAAESGANFQSMRIFPLAGASVCSNLSFNLSNSGLNGCIATTQCNLLTVNGINFYRVISEGQCNVGQQYQATRTIEVRLQSLN